MISAVVCIVAAATPALESPTLALTLRLIQVEAQAAEVAAVGRPEAPKAALFEQRLTWLRAALKSAPPLRDREQATLRRTVMRRIAAAESDLADRAGPPGDKAAGQGEAAGQDEEKRVAARLRVLRRWAADLGAEQTHLTVADLMLERGLLTGRLRYAEAVGAKARIDRLRQRLAQADKALDSRRPLNPTARVKGMYLLMDASSSLRKDRDESDDPKERDEIDVVADTLLILALER